MPASNNERLTRKSNPNPFLRAFEDIFENINEPSFLLGTHRELLAANRKARDLTGISRREHDLKDYLRKSVSPRSRKRLAKRIKDAYMGKSQEFELEFKLADGRLTTAEIVLMPLKDRKGNVKLLGIARNATEQKQAEQKLKDTKELFETITENADLIAVQGFDRHGKVLHWNRMSSKLYGIKREEIMGKNAFEFSPFKKGTRELKKTFDSVWSSGKPASPIEWQLVTGSSERRWIYSSISPVMRRGKIVEVICTDLDLTDRKMLEERLSTLNVYASRLNTAQRREQIYELTLDAMEEALGFESAAFMIADRGYLQVACQRGYPDPSLKLPLNGSKRGITVRAAQIRTPIIVPDVKKDDDYVEGIPNVGSELAVPVEIEGRMLGVLDVESKRLEAFNKKDVSLLQVLASHAATALSNLEKREEIEKRSMRLASLMKSSAEMIHSTDVHKRLQKIAEAMREHGWRRVVIRAVKSENMEVPTPEDLVTSGLTEEEREFLWDNRMPGQVWRERFGPEYERFKIGEFYHLPWNDPWVRKKFSEGTVPSKLSEEEMVDWNPQDFLYAPLRLADGRIVGVLSIDDPVDGKRPTKESLAPLELFIHQAAVAIENAQLFQELHNAKDKIREYADQLELKVKQRTQQLVEAQKKLIKTERLAAIGEVAAMVGHDMRNPLTGITGATYYLKMKLGSKMSKKELEMFQIIEKDIEYSNKIVNDLLDYSREIMLELTETSAKSLVKDALSMVRIPRNVRIISNTENNLRIAIDLERMKRVFVNIIKNAIDAMPEGGKLTIDSRRTENKVTFDFADTGTGMARGTLEKLWSPLFTTKARGMGFGLPICKRIIEAHGGSVRVSSAVGKGTTFTIDIPIVSRLEGEVAADVDVKQELSLPATRTWKAS